MGLGETLDVGAERTQDAVATITALMVCSRFSAWSNTIEASEENTSSVTSSSRMPVRSCTSRAVDVFRTWKAGRARSPRTIT